MTMARIALLTGGDGGALKQILKPEAIGPLVVVNVRVPRMVTTPSGERCPQYVRRPRVRSALEHNTSKATTCAGTQGMPVTTHDSLFV